MAEGYNHTLVDTAANGAGTTVDVDTAGPMLGWAGDTRRDPRAGVAEAYPTPAAVPYPTDYLAEARRDAEMQQAINTVPAQDYVPYPSTSGGAGIGQGIGQKGWCTGDSHFYACKHETVCTCGKTGRITVAPGL